MSFLIYLLGYKCAHCGARLRELEHPLVGDKWLCGNCHFTVQAEKKKIENERLLEQSREKERLKKEQERNERIAKIEALPEGELPNGQYRLVCRFGCPYCKEPFEAVEILLRRYDPKHEERLSAFLKCPLCYNEWSVEYEETGSIGFSKRHNDGSVTWCCIYDCKKCGTKRSWYYVHHWRECRKCGLVDDSEAMQY